MNLFIAAKEKFKEDYQKQLEAVRKTQAEQTVDGFNQLNDSEETKRLK
ncbi:MULTISPECIES: hypothetical protein [Bacillus]|nr:MULTISPECIES: hypothetical protein [Bacillus]WFA04146.1 hypothetical protein P3X63_16135 [Bacillus sp. HSf4]